MRLRNIWLTAALLVLFVPCSGRAAPLVIESLHERGYSIQKLNPYPSGNKYITQLTETDLKQKWALSEGRAIWVSRKAHSDWTGKVLAIEANGETIVLRVKALRVGQFASGGANSVYVQIVKGFPLEIKGRRLLKVKGADELVVNLDGARSVHQIYADKKDKMATGCVTTLSDFKREIK